MKRQTVDLNEKVLSLSVGEIAACDLNRAMEIVENMTTESNQQRALVNIASSIAASDPDRAIEVTEKLISWAYEGKTMFNTLKAISASRSAVKINK